MLEACSLCVRVCMLEVCSQGDQKGPPRVACLCFLLGVSARTRSRVSSMPVPGIASSPLLARAGKTKTLMTCATPQPRLHGAKSGHLSAVASQRVWSPHAAACWAQVLEPEQRHSKLGFFGRLDRDTTGALPADAAPFPLPISRAQAGCPGCQAAISFGMGSPYKSMAV